jgi:xanthine dehydrogenase accessory factor
VTPSASPAAILARAAELGTLGRPFALATVVGAHRPTSAKPGARGIVHPDGTVEGWVGGSCAQPTVVREALRALADGEPRLVRISPEPLADGRRSAGIVDVVMTCHSGGTLEIFVEPHLAAAELWVTGITPIARALVELGAGMGFRATAIDPEATAELFPAAATVVAGRSFDALVPGGPPYAVVASQGQWDEEALEALLRRDVAYVGLVASPRRAAAVREYLALASVPPERLAALRAPCGLDVGAATPGEVAVSILAELVQVRRGRAPFVAAPGPATLAGQGTADPSSRAGATAAARADTALATPAGRPPAAATPADIVLDDPVCGMTVARDEVRHVAEHEGVTYAFCAVGCRSRFVRNPARYLALAGT